MVGVGLLSLLTHNKVVLALTRILACKIHMLELLLISAKVNPCHNNTAVNTVKMSASLRDRVHLFKLVGLARLPTLSPSRAGSSLLNLSNPGNRHLVDILSMAGSEAISAVNRMLRALVMVVTGQMHSDPTVPMVAEVAGTTKLDYHDSSRDASKSRLFSASTMAKHVCIIEANHSHRTGLSTKTSVSYNCTCTQGEEEQCGVR